MIRAALSNWNSHDLWENGRSAESRAEDTVEDRLRYLKAVRSGTPVTQLILDDCRPAQPENIDSYASQGVDLKGPRVAWLSKQWRTNDRVIVHDLFTGARHVFQDEAMQSISAVVLTMSHVAFVSFGGVLSMADLRESDPEPWRIRLPSGSFDHIAADGDVVVLCLTKAPCSNNTLPELLFIYDVTHRKMSSIGVPEQLTVLDPFAVGRSRLVVNARHRTIDLFVFFPVIPAERPGKTSVTRAAHVRLQFDGTVVRSSAYHDSVERDFRFTWKLGCASIPLKLGYKNEYRFIVAQTESDGTKKTATEIQFDTTTCTFSLPKSDDRRSCLIASSAHIPRRRKHFDHAVHAVWKDLQYHVQDSPQSSCSDLFTLVNEAFLVTLVAGGQLGRQLKVYCFDHKIKMEGAMPYKCLPATVPLIGWEEAHAADLRRGGRGFGDLFWENERRRRRDVDDAIHASRRS